MSQNTSFERISENDKNSSLKAIEILESLAGEREGLGISEISRICGLSKSTVHRILTALVESRYVIKEEITRRYRLGYKLLQLSSQLLDSIELRQIAKTELMELAKLSNETIHLVWLDGFEGVYIEKIDTSEGVGLLSRVGKRLNLYSTSAGKAILAYMDEKIFSRYMAETKLIPVTKNTIITHESFLEELQTIKNQGFAFDREENREGIVCVGAPIFEANGKPVAAVSVSAPLYRFPVEKAEALGPLVREKAYSISGKLGYIVDSNYLNGRSDN